MLETAVVVDWGHNPIYWHLPNNRSSSFIPDSATLWDVIWKNRSKIMGVAHSHPGEFVHPSSEDLTTFAAVEAGLGVPLLWWITTASKFSLTTWNGSRYQTEVIPVAYPPWVSELRRLSYSEYWKNTDSW